MTTTSSPPATTAVAVDGGPQRRLLDPLPECGAIAVNPYRQCDIRCTYCITGSQGRSEPRVDDAELLDQLRAELAVVPADALLAVGAICDAYPSVERDLGVTRRILAELARQERRFTIITKGTTVVRDIDLLAGTTITFSMSSVDQQVLDRVEPGAPAAVERLEAARAVRRRGIRVNISAIPWIPGLSDARALIDEVRGRVGSVPIMIGPLNVRAPQVEVTPTGRRFTQAEVNTAFLAERARVGEDYGVVWLQPLPTTGHHALEAPLGHCTDQHHAEGAAMRLEPPRRRTAAAPG